MKPADIATGDLYSHPTRHGREVVQVAHASTVHGVTLRHITHHDSNGAAVRTTVPLDTFLAEWTLAMRTHVEGVHAFDGVAVDVPPEVGGLYVPRTDTDVVVTVTAPPSLARSRTGITALVVHWRVLNATHHTGITPLARWGATFLPIEAMDIPRSRDHDPADLNLLARGVTPHHRTRSLPEEVAALDDKAA